MQLAKKRALFIGIIIGVIYVFGIVVYYSLAPWIENYCPIQSQENDAILLNDSAYPDHIFKVINDASCLNKTRVYDIIKVTSIDKIRDALALARTKEALKVSIAGRRHSMGGQAFAKDAIVLDITHFNRILSLDEKNKILTVQSGATWHDIQLFLNPKNLAVKAMQSTDIWIAFSKRAWYGPHYWCISTDS